jgi:phospho-N-acetylmuramoyl-pentapeptide-transferase
MMKIALMCMFTAWILGIVLGPVLIPLLRVLKFGQLVRSDGPKGHFKKAGTPTMGGLIFILSMVGTLLIWSNLSLEVLLSAGMVIGFGLLGLMDDLIKVVMKRPLGLKARAKILGQLLLALLLIYTAVNVLGRGTELILPLTGEKWDLGIWYYVLALIRYPLCRRSSTRITGRLKDFNIFI